MPKGRPAKKLIPTIIVYKKTPKGKLYLKVFEDTHPDDIINTRKRNPLLPDNYEIVRMGMGRSFIEEYKKEYNIKKIS